MFEDLRAWIDMAKKIGEVVVIEDVDIDDFGPVSQITSRNEGPAVLFHNINGYPPGFRMATNLMSNIRTFNLTLGLPLDFTIKQTVEVLSKKVAEWAESSGQFSPTVVDKAPILDNVKEGNAIDLDIFPVPLWHELDGGPYIGVLNSMIVERWASI